MTGSAASAPSTIGLRFTERMSGSVILIGPPQASQTLEFTTTITAEDLDRFLEDSAHLAALSGTVSSPLFGNALPIVSGTFQLLVNDLTQVNTRHFNYTFSFTGTDGRPYVLEGQKTVRNDQGAGEIWAATTTLAVKLHQGTDTKRTRS